MDHVAGKFADLGADGAPANLGIMGGTFDPPHIGHLVIADEVRSALGLTGVLFMPAGAPVFKKDHGVTDARMRLEMCRLAVGDDPHFDVSPLEVDRPGDTFTVDTMRALRVLFPENVSFTFIVGSDAAASVPQWRGVEELAGLCSLAVACGRPGSKSAGEIRALVAEATGMKVETVEATSLEVASSTVRARIREGLPVRYLLPAAVGDYIQEHGLYGLDAGADGQAAELAPDGAQEAYSEEFFLARKAELAQRVSERRYQHVMGVVDTCEQLARRFGVDERAARLAGLLHDWDKAYDNEGIRARVRELGMEEQVGPWLMANMPQVLHGPTAARALGRDFPCIPAEVLHAIDVHTAGAVEMSDLDKVLYIADGLEPGRRYGRIDELRALAQEPGTSLDDLFFATYRYWILLLFEHGTPLHPDTIRIWNAHTLRRAAQKG